MASVLSAVWLTIGFVVLQAGVILLITLLAPAMVERAAAALRTRPFLSVLIGATIWFIVLQWFSSGPLQRPGLWNVLEDVRYNFGQFRISSRATMPGIRHLLVWLLGGPVVALLCLGLGGLARVLSDTFQSRWGARSAAALVGATACISGALAAPVLSDVYLLPWAGSLNRGYYPAVLIPVSIAVGWEVLLPLLSCAALGSACLALIPTKATRREGASESNLVSGPSKKEGTDAADAR